MTEIFYAIYFYIPSLTRFSRNCIACFVKSWIDCKLSSLMTSFFLMDCFLNRSWSFSMFLLWIYFWLSIVLLLCLLISNLGVSILLTSTRSFWMSSFAEITGSSAKCVIPFLLLTGLKKLWVNSTSSFILFYWFYSSSSLYLILLI